MRRTAVVPVILILLAVAIAVAAIVFSKSITRSLPQTASTEETTSAVAKPADLQTKPPSSPDMQVSAPSSPEKAKAKIPWLNDYNKALAQAKSQKKPLMIDFYATWCGPCHQLDDETYSDARVGKAAASFVNLRVDVDRQKPLTDKFQIEAMPTIVFLDSTGQEVHRILGFKAADDMLYEMAEAKKKIG